MPFIKHIPFDRQKFCQDPQHNPPGLQWLEPGTHIWQCPSCGAQVPEVTCDQTKVEWVSTKQPDIRWEGQSWCQKDFGDQWHAETLGYRNDTADGEW